MADRPAAPPRKADACAAGEAEDHPPEGKRHGFACQAVDEGIAATAAGATSDGEAHEWSANAREQERQDTEGGTA